LEDDQMDQPAITGTVLIDVEPIARVVAMDVASVHKSLQRLAASSLVSFEEVQDPDGIEVSIEPAFKTLAVELVALLIRDLMERHGADLRHVAERAMSDLDSD